MAYREWRPAGGATTAPTVLCAHGLTRTGGDFDRLAATLAAEGRRVVCPDIVGRGLSDRLPDAALYGVPQYVADCVTLLARLDGDAERDAPIALDWVGTSMGGLIGMALAGLARPGGVASPIGRLLLNDIGPVLSREGLARIAGYVGGPDGVLPRYADFAAAERALRETMASFGPHGDEEFRLLSRHHFVEGEDGWRAHYDPAIAAPFADAPTEDVTMWPLWNALECPVTVLRGAESDLLSTTTAESMRRGGPDGAGPRATLVTVAGVGHAPTLIRASQIDAVRRFLDGEPQPTEPIDG